MQSNLTEEDGPAYDSSVRRLAFFLVILAAAIPARAGRGRWTSSGPGPDVYLVVADPVRSGVVYASIGSPQSLHRTVDGGRSWEAISSPWPYSVAVDASSPDTLYLGGFSIYRSGDAGGTWALVVPDLTANYIQNIVVAPDDPDVLYVETHTLASGTYGTDSYRFARVRRETDGTWDWSVPDPDFTTQVTGLVADASSSATIFASGVGGAYRSTDGGGSWTTLATGIPSDTWAEKVAIHPGAPSWLYVPIATTSVPVHGVAVSRDGGDTWTIETNGLPDGPLKCAAVDPRDPEIAYVGSVDAGVFRTVDGGRTWTPFDGGISSSAVFSLAVDLQGRVYAGTAAGVFTVDPLSVEPVPAASPPAFVRRR